jgi:hypothetical protein
LNNKIYISEPNSRISQNTKSLRYLGQIEWVNNKIIDFYVKHDWELLILNKTWMYKIKVEIDDYNKLTIR